MTHQSPTAAYAEQIAELFRQRDAANATTAAQSALFDASRARAAARHTIGTTGAVTASLRKAQCRAKAMREQESAGYRNLGVPFRELLAEAKGYRNDGWSHHDAARIALDSCAPYHELLRGH